MLGAGRRHARACSGPAGGMLGAGGRHARGRRAACSGPAGGMLGMLGRPLLSFLELPTAGASGLASAASSNKY